MMYKEIFDRTNPKYKEIIRLHGLLEEAGIPHTLRAFKDGWQVCYPTDGPGRVADAIEHCCSYGSDEDLLEIMGLLTGEEYERDSFLGYLTAENVFERMKKHWSALRR